LAGQEQGLCALSYTNITEQAECYGGQNYEPVFSPLSTQIYSVNITVDHQQMTILQRFRNSAAPLTLADAYANEVVLTAEKLISTNTMLSVFVKSDYNQNPNQPVSSFDEHNPLFTISSGQADSLHTSLLQYGDPNKAYQLEDYSSFDLQQTLSRLQQHNLGQSLQARVLETGGFMRVFKIESIVNCNNSQTHLSNFYDTTFNDVISCSIEQNMGKFYSHIKTIRSTTGTNVGNQQSAFHDVYYYCADKNHVAFFILHYYRSHPDGVTFYL
jgi:hypothetical protein